MYLSQIDEMLTGELDLIFIMPYEFEDLDPEKFRDFNRNLFNHRFDFENYDVGDDIDLQLTSYYSSCESDNLIPENIFLELVKIMLIDLESRSFSSLFSGSVGFYDIKYSNEYFTYFFNLFDVVESPVARDNMRMYMTEIFDDNRYWAKDEAFKDSSLTSENLKNLQMLREL